MSIGAFPISASPIAGSTRSKIVIGAATLVANSTLTTLASVIHRGSTTIAAGSTIISNGHVIRGATATIVGDATVTAIGTVFANLKPYNFELDAGAVVSWQTIDCVINSESADTKRIVVGSSTGQGTVIGSINGQVVEHTVFGVSDGVNFANSIIIRNV